MADLLKKPKIPVGSLAVLLGVALLVTVGLVFLLAPTQGPVFVSIAAPQIGVAVDQNRVVADVLPGSPAEKAGLARGDIIKQVGNSTLTSDGDWVGAVRQEIAAKTTPIADPNVIGNFKVTALSLVVGRGNQDLTLTLTPVSPPFVRRPANQALPTATAVPVSAGWTYL